MYARRIYALSRNLSNDLPDDTTVRIVKLPPRIHAMVVRHDCYNTILISEDLSAEGQVRACRHEISHIKRGDFDSDLSVDEIESAVHAEKGFK